MRRKFQVNREQSDFYSISDVVWGTRMIETIFSTRSNEAHKSLIRPIWQFHSNKNILGMETLIDRAIMTLCQQSEERFIDSNSRACNISDWIGYCT